MDPLAYNAGSKAAVSSSDRRKAKSEFVLNEEVPPFADLPKDKMKKKKKKRKSKKSSSTSSRYSSNNVGIEAPNKLNNPGKKKMKKKQGNAMDNRNEANSRNEEKRTQKPEGDPLQQRHVSKSSSPVKKEEPTPSLPAVLPAIYDRRGRATGPGVMHVHPHNQNRQAEERDSSSSQSDPENFQDDGEEGDTDIWNGSSPGIDNTEADSSAHLIQAELVDEDAIRQQALLDSVQATAELLEEGQAQPTQNNDNDDESDGGDVNVKNHLKRSRWMVLLLCCFCLGRNSTQQTSFLPFALCCCCLITTAAVIPAVVVTNMDKNDNDSDIQTDSTQQPSISPSSFPSLAPVDLDTPWVLVTEDALDGQVSNPFPPGSGTSGGPPYNQVNGEFGNLVAIANVPTNGTTSRENVFGTSTNKTLYVAATFGTQQTFLENTTRHRELPGLHERNLDIQESKKLALYLCHTSTGCEPGPYLSGSYVATWDQMCLSGDGGRLAMAVAGRLLLFFFQALAVEPFESRDVEVMPVLIPEATNTTLVAMNQEGSLLAAASDDELRVFSVFEGLGTPGVGAGDEYSSGPNMHSNGAPYFWDNTPEAKEKIVALACNGLRAAIGTNIENQSFKVRVLRQGYKQYVGQTIENSETGRSILYNNSLQLAANGTILAFSSRKSNVSGGEPLAERVEVYQLVNDDSTWVPLGQPLQSPKNGIAFGASVSLSEDGTILAVGAPLYSTDRDDFVGRVFTYWLEGEEWLPLGEVSGRSSSSESGWSAALSSDGDVLVVGSPKSGLRGSLTGEVNVYSLADSGSN